jgi:hypothetical protein
MLVIVTPVFNDWKTFAILYERITKNFPIDSLRFVVVNDGSTELPEKLADNVTVLNLTRNMGHQKAIAIGLSYTSEILSPDNVFVLDSDGEDDPSAMNILLKKSVESGKVVFASRGRRNEGLFFKMGYFIYRILFKMLTGRFIRFGNYSCIPGKLLADITHMSEIWYNYPGAIAASKIPHGEIKVDRAMRYCGSSKMNFMGLVLHGLGAISIQFDRLAVRAIIAATVGAVISIAGIGIVLGLKFIAHQATPGWATSAIGGFTIILLQFLAIAGLASFFAISQKNQRGVIPAIDWKIFVKKSNNKADNNL